MLKRNIVGNRTFKFTKPCYLCGSYALKEFSKKTGRYSLTTDGRRIPLALRNAQCYSCGMMQKLQSHKKIFSHLSYQKDYELYNRPNMKNFDANRYRNYAEWIAQYFPTSSDKLKILEVGCGEGWILEILQDLYPQHYFEGIEPSLSASKNASEHGVKVTAGSLDENNRLFVEGQFDFIFSVNVIEHTPDPIKFLKNMTPLIKPDGRVLAICPNSDVLSVESLFIDHLFSFRKSNLKMVFQKAGLKPLKWSGGQKGFEELQLLTGSPSKQIKLSDNYTCSNILIRKRHEYMNAWHNLEAVLKKRLLNYDELICFGAGETSDLLSIFAPQIWTKVSAYAIDGNSNDMKRKHNNLPLYSINELERNNVLLIGTKPHYQNSLYERLSKFFSKVIKWNDIVKL